MNLIPLSRRHGWRIAGVLALVGTLLSACGGGTSVINAFHPSRLIVFGDEHSALAPDGHHYSINGKTNGVFDCGLNPVWTQIMASSYGFVFKECNPAAVAAPQALMQAKAGAKVADLATQFAAVTGLGVGDLVTVMMGANDIIEVYETHFGAGKTWTAAEETAAGNELTARGEALAVQVMALMDRGAKVVLVTVPDLGLSPYAITDKNVATHTDRDRAALLSALGFTFNARLRVAIEVAKHYDGRDYALVLGDETVQVMALAPSSFGLTNVDTIPDVTTAACDPVLVAAGDGWCYRPFTPAATDTAPATTGTLVTAATDTNHLWATDRLLGPVAQGRIGLLAQTRAQGNPF
jgi:hypothetical protein